MDSTLDKASFNDLKEFFLSWGLWPALEPLQGDASLGNSDGECIINAKCYERMCNVAKEEYGENFLSFVSRMVDATDGEFYLSAGSWTEVLDAWEEVAE